jgi:hypothetical protein
MANKFKGRIVFSDNYKSTIQSIKSISNPNQGKIDIKKAINDEHYSLNGVEIGILSPYNEKSKLTPFNLLANYEVAILAAYDESILELNSLEGKARCIAHSCVIQDLHEYHPSGYITLKFFTKSALISKKTNEYSDIILSEDLSKEMLDHYIQERSDFLTESAPSDSYIFIDGPLFSGAATNGNFHLIDSLSKKRTFPIFFVKNSESSIITENFEFAKKYNNDLHWANTVLSEMEMSPLFYYKSNGDRRGKAMCFIKIYWNRSPIRIEIPLIEFESGCYNDNIFNLIAYQYLANGGNINIQPRIIQVAEIYAREMLKSTNIYREIEELGLTNTMNELRSKY